MTNDPNAPITIPQGYQFTAPNYGITQSQQQLRNPSIQAPEQGGGSYAANIALEGAEQVTKQIAPGLWYWWVKYKNANAGFRQDGPFAAVHGVQAPEQGGGSYAANIALEGAEQVTKQIAPGLWYLAKYKNANAGFRQDGPFAAVHGARTSSELDARTYGVEHLPPVTNITTSFQPTDIQFRFISSVNAFGHLVFALYNAVGPNYTPLYRENADGSLTQLTYSNGTTHRIKGLAMLQIDGTPYLAVLKENEPIELLSDVADTPTSAGSMHSDTSGAWGAVMTTLPDSSHLIFTGSTVLAGTATQAIADPHTVEGNVPVGGGGFPMGVQSINSGDVRVRFVALAPEAASSAQVPGIDLSGNQFQGAVYSCSQRGDDVQQWKLPVRFVSQAILIRDGIAYSNGYTAGWDDGREHFDFGSTRGRDAFASTTSYVVGFYKKNDDLYLERTSLGDGTVTRWVEYFDWTKRELLNASKHQTYTTSVGVAPYSAAGAGSLPVSEATGLLWQWFVNPADNTTIFFSQFQPQDAPGLYDTRFTWTPELGPLSSTTVPNDIAGLEGKVKTWHRVYFGGEVGVDSIFIPSQVDLDIGGTSVTGNLIASDPTFDPNAVISQRETFRGGTNMASRWRRRQFNRNRFRRLIVTTTLTAPQLVEGTAFPDTPNAMFYIIEGLAYDDKQTFEKWSQRGQVQWS